jgi:peptidylprolyl isomerase
MKPLFVLGPALAAAFALAPPAFAADAPAPATPSAIVAAAPAAAWKAIDPDGLLVLDVKGGGRVVIALAPGFAPAHVANIKTFAAAHYYDGLWIERVQENYVVQWGDPDGKKPLPPGIAPKPPAEYERAAAGLAFRPIAYRDVFAPQIGFAGGWPVAEEGGVAWLPHCYSMVGVGRGMAPDTGSGAELYAVIGQSPRHLDRNITVVGRVVAGMEVLTARPRGTEALGFYKTTAEMTPFTRVRLASDLPEGERPRFAMLDTETPTFAAWVKARANRKDDFFVRPAGAVDICNVLPPVKEGRP